MVKGNAGTGEQREPQLSPSSARGTTVEQEEGKEELLAINQQQMEKGGSTTVSPAVHCPLMGESKCQTNCVKRIWQFVNCLFLP